MMRNKLAVCMPVYNAESTIYRSIESILKQTYKDFTFIITDDCSTDKTVKIIESINDSRIILLKNKMNLGTVPTRNKMLEYCIKNNYQYMAIMDADDIAFPKRFEKQMLILNNDQSLAVCGSSMEIERTGGVWIAPKDPNRIKTECLFGNPIPTSTAIICLRYMQNYRLQWDINFSPCADYHLWYVMLYVHNLRASNTGDVDMIYTYSIDGVSHGNGLLRQEKKDAKIKQLMFKFFDINTAENDAFSFMKVALYRSDDPEHSLGFLKIASQILKSNSQKRIVGHSALRQMMSHRASIYLKKTRSIPKKIKRQISNTLVVKFYHLIAGLESMLAKIKNHFIDLYFPNLSMELVKLYFRIRSKLTDLD